MAPDQRLRLAGTEVEYLFGTDVIAVRAGHLIDASSAKAAPCGLTQWYWQVLLDRAAPMKIAGVIVEGLDITGVQIDPSLRQYSTIAALPAELVPARPADQVPLLQSYETLTLRKLTGA